MNTITTRDEYSQTTYVIETQDSAGNWDAYGLGGPDVQTCDNIDEARHLVDHATESGVLDGDRPVRIVTMENGKRTLIERVR